MANTIVVDEMDTQTQLGPAPADAAAAKLQDFHTSTDGAINSHVAEVLEADGLRETLITRMTTAFKALAVSEDSLSKGLVADAVQSVANVLGLPESNRPKYAKIAELILRAQGRDVRAASQVKLSDETLETRTSKSNVYRQYATPFVALARWEQQQYTKGEIAHLDRNPNLARQIVYGNQVFTSPILALKDGVPYSTCYRLFRNVFAPSYSDLSGLDTEKNERVAVRMAKEKNGRYLGRHKIVILGKTDEGAEKRATVPVTTMSSLVVGTIIGLVEAWNKPLNKGQFDRIQAALALVAPAPEKPTV